MRIASWARLFSLFMAANRYGMDELLYQFRYLRHLRFLYYLYPVHWFLKTRRLPLGTRITLFLEALGPLYVKLGQIASTRPDIFPPTLIEQLSRLRDQVEPFSDQALKQRLTLAYGDYHQHFATVEETPLASASVAQVHRATLRADTQQGIAEGTPVVIKVLRPHIEQQAYKDLALFDDLSSLIAALAPSLKRFHLAEIIQELKRVLTVELDLRKEEAAISFFQSRYQAPGASTMHAAVVLPRIYPSLTTKHVLVMSEVSGITVSDHHALEQHGVSRPQLATMALDIFFEQIFNFDRFHADLHPGNLFIDATNPKQPRWVLLDFGIVGTLSARDKYYIASNVFAMLNKDFDAIAQLHLDSQWLPDNADIDSFIQDISQMVSLLYDKKITDISMGKLLLMVFSTARKHQINIQPQLILLQKTILNLEALARSLDPNLDLWAYSKPKLKQWLATQKSITTTIKRWLTFFDKSDTFLSTQSLQSLGDQFGALTKNASTLSRQS